MPNHPYRGRLAPSPTGYLHLGHASTFLCAFERAREHAGVLIMRNEDLDPQRVRAEFAHAMLEDLRWYGIEWQEGPDVGGAFGPYAQSQRREFYLDAWSKLQRGGAYLSWDLPQSEIASGGTGRSQLALSCARR